MYSAVVHEMLARTIHADRLEEAKRYTIADLVGDGPPTRSARPAHALHGLLMAAHQLMIRIGQPDAEGSTVHAGRTQGVPG